MHTDGAPTRPAGGGAAGERPRAHVVVPARLGEPTGDECILHLDMDAFYASVEIRDDPRLAGRPVLVAGGGRSVVTAASYEARRYGVHSAMPTAVARRRCPHAVIVAPNYDKYRHESAAIRRILDDATPLVEPLALDEAFLDVTGSRRLLGDPVTIGTMLRTKIRDERGLVASVGIGTSKLVAKLGSRAAKPDGLVCIPAGTELAFLHPLPVTALWGVGAATAAELAHLGIATVADLAHTDTAILARHVGTAHARHLHALANAHDPSPVVPDRAPKSIGHEQTFDTDLADPDAIRTELLRAAERVARRLRDGGWLARTITVKCRLAGFRTLTRARTLATPVASGPDVFAAACDGWDRLSLDRPAVRLLGVAASGLTTEPGATQLGLALDLGDTSAVASRSGSPGSPGGPGGNGSPGGSGAGTGPDWDALMVAQDAVRARFGDDALAPARLLGGAGTRRDRPVAP